MSAAGSGTAEAANWGVHIVDDALNIRRLPQVASRFLPATHFSVFARGIVIRGAGFAHLAHHVCALVGLSTVLVLASTRAFRKTVG